MGRVLLFWVQTVQFTLSGRGAKPAAQALLHSSHIWILLLLTFSIVLPWLRLRRVPVRVCRPSSHVALAPIFTQRIGPLSGQAYS